MRRFSNCWVLVALLMSPVLALAQSAEIPTAHDNPSSIQLNEPLTLAPEESVTALPAGTAVEAGSLELQAKDLKRTNKAPRRAAAIDDLVGDYVITYLSLTSSGADGGRYAYITRVGETDSVLIHGFYYSDANVKARYYQETGALEIPSQVIGNAQQGVLDLSVVNTNGTPNRTEKIRGQLNADGSISFSTWWAIFLNGTDYTNAIVYAGYNTDLEKANGTLTVNTPTGAESYGVVISQPSANMVSVKNFGNWGVSVELELKRDQSATIMSQAARHDRTNGDWMTYAAQYAQNDDGSWSLTGYAATITTNVATDNKNITWGPWCILNLTARQYLGAMFDGKLTWNTGEFSYPSISVTDFEGEGTEASPYLIKTLDELILLSDKVNENTNYDYGSGSYAYARNYLGKYFRLENDIDMNNYRFTPIGNRWSAYFAGTFDGNGHTLSNLNISTGAAGYAALFGKCDTVSVIKNLNVDGAVIDAAGYYAAAIAGWSLGTVTNCHVKNVNVTNTGIAAAGVAGIVTYMSDCSTEKSTITGLGGFAAGVVGEIDRDIRNCHAISTTVNAGAAAEGYPAGGVVAELYHNTAFATPTTASDLYFAGTVRGDYNRTQNLLVGGVIGTAYRSAVERCYNTGYVTGYYNYAYVGGVVGCLQGSSLKNSYNVGRVQDASSRFCGGITGYVLTATATGTVEQSSVEECYTAGQIVAETYQYNKETDVRETLGTVADNAASSLRAIYNDKQIVDFTTLQYVAKTADLTSANGPEGFTASKWVFTEGCYPRISGMENTETAKYSASALVLKSDNTTSKVIDDAKLNALGNTQFRFMNNGYATTEGHFMKVQGDDLIMNGGFGTDTLLIMNGDDYRFLLLKASPIRMEGEGSEDNPFLIKTKEDLILLSDISTNLEMYFPETYFLVANDIDVEYDERFNGLCTDADNAHCQFEGTIDGGGHTIHRMKLGNVFWQEGQEPVDHFGDGTGTPNTNLCKGWIGFIGRLSVEGVLKNLNIAADCQINVWATAGALVGANYGKIINCRNYADVTGISCWIGGIAGSVENGGLIDSCYNEGNVMSGYMNAGGITGRCYGVIRNSMNVGDVTVKRLANFGGNNLFSAAGISGSGDGAYFENVINAGNITTANSRAGGIAASLPQTTGTSYANHNDLINVINYGSVNCPDQTAIGAIGGYAGTNGNITTGEIQNVYWDGQVITVGAVANKELNGAQGIETNVLISGNKVGNLPEDVFQFDRGLYPVLKIFADEPAVQNARAVYPLINTGETATNLASDFTLNTPQGTVWSLNQGTDFAINGDQVVVPVDNEDVVTDTLVATYGRYVKNIILKRLVSLPLDGEGTAESPFLIKSTTDWNNVVNYMDACAETFEGKYLQVANDFTVTENEPILSLGSTAYNFQGDLDGAGHTISAINITTTATNQGLINIIGDKGYVHDLTVEGQVNSTFNYTGGIVGTLSGKLANITSRVNVTSTRQYTGGVVGLVTANASLENVLNEGNVSASSTYVAGVAGYVNQGVTLYHVGNKGKVSQTGTSNYISGLVGYSYPATYIGCYNEGEISVANTNNTQYAAGLIANVVTGTARFYLDSCYNTANITAKALVAGLITCGTSVKYKVDMNHCYNTGDIYSASTTAVSSAPTAGIAVTITAGSTYRNTWNSGKVTTDKNLYCAGVLGYNVSDGTLETLVDSCYNLGDVTANGNQGAGLIAYTPNYTTISNCYNKGNVVGTWGVGGLINCLSGSATKLSSCVNYGNVEGNANRIGGITGYGSPEGVYDCVNFGDISTTSEVQGTAAAAGYGIGGIAGQLSGKIIRCANYGTITGACLTAGILGRSNAAGKTETATRTVLENCYSAGKVVAPTDSCGNVLGVSVENNGNVWGPYNVLDNCYYIADGVTRLDAPLAIAATSEELAATDMGEGWVETDNYTYPIQSVHADNELLLVSAAQVVLPEQDGEPAPAPRKADITVDLTDVVLSTPEFNVGAPEGVTWTANPAIVEFNGNSATITQSYTGEITLTVTAGEYSKDVIINVDLIISAIDDINANNGNVISEEYYNLNGQRIVGHVDNGQVVIVKRTYSDGTTTAVKVAIKK